MWVLVAALLLEIKFERARFDVRAGAGEDECVIAVCMHVVRKVEEDRIVEHDHLRAGLALGLRVTGRRPIRVKVIAHKRRQQDLTTAAIACLEEAVEDVVWNVAVAEAKERS